MESNNCNELKLQELLCRFIDPDMLTPELLEISYNYLFGQDYHAPFFINTDLYETIVYLKDLMEVNELNSLDDILNHYEKKKRILNVFIETSFEIGESNVIEIKHLSEIDWQKDVVRKPLPEIPPINGTCLCLCCALRSNYPTPVLTSTIIGSCLPKIDCKLNYEEDDFNYSEQETISLSKHAAT